MTNRNKIILLTLAVILVLAIAKLTTQDTNKDTLQNIPSPNQEIEAGWKTLTSSNYSLSYPEEATSEARENESLIFFMGPKQIASGRTQTELFDGYSFRIESTLIPPNTDIENFAESQRKSAQDNCLSYETASVSELKSITITNQPAFQYSAEGCYIDYTETILSFNNNTYRISQSYTGDKEDQTTYKEITNIFNL